MCQVPHRFRRVLAGLLFITLAAVEAFAQATEGSLRGSIRDEQGAPMPGVTVTAKSSAATRPLVTITDDTGAYRLLNVAPGDYTVSAELTGFSTSIRENVSVRAGLNLAIDFTLTVGALAESVKVTADNPLLEASGATQAVNVSNEMQRSLPLAGHRHWSEFLRLVPGAVSRDSTVNQAATFYIHGAGIVSFSTLVDGADITSAVNPWQAYSALPDETAADVQIKTNGFDAATPLGMA